MMDAPRSFSEFWPHYVAAHRHPATRAVHCAATLLGWGLLASAVVFRNAWLALAAPIVPYPLVWLSHFYIEHNRPASFGHPGWSWLADQKMVYLMLTGKMGSEVRRSIPQANR